MISVLFLFFVLYATSVLGHLSDTCPSHVKLRKLYTRKNTDYTDMMYFWTATYSHGSVSGSGLQGFGGGCYKKSDRKIYFKASTSSQPTCGGGDGDKNVWWSSNQYTSWATRLSNHNVDIPSARPHCNTNINFRKKWHLVGEGFRIPGPTNAASDAPLYVTLCFSGFMCEAIQVSFPYIVYKGCDKGYYEDTSITWPKATSGGNASPEYCLQCPPGQYQDQRDQLKGSGTVCKQCIEGRFGDESNVPNRDSTNYCAKCPAGRFGNSRGSTDPLCAGACLPGYYCPSSGSLNTRNTGGTSGADLKVSQGYFGGSGAQTADGSSECAFLVSCIIFFYILFHPFAPPCAMCIQSGGG